MYERVPANCQENHLKWCWGGGPSLFWVSNLAVVILPLSHCSSYFSPFLLPVRLNIASHMMISVINYLLLTVKLELAVVYPQNVALHPLFVDRIGIWKCYFLWVGKPLSTTERTNNKPNLHDIESGIWTQATLSGG